MQTYKGDHEKMKVAVNKVAEVLQTLEKIILRLTESAKDGKLAERGHPEAVQGAYADIVRGVNGLATSKTNWMASSSATDRQGARAVSIARPGFQMREE
jgi:hypothetical protein